MNSRKIFFDTLLEMAREDKDIIILVGDLGFSFMEEFQRELPGQIINMGICEQNMIGVAAGLALAGKKPYCYSGAVFLLCRAYEQVRDDVCYNNLNVKLIGTGAADFLGFSHNFSGYESDRDLLINLPNIKRHFPQTEEELVKILKDKTHAPEYIRL